MKVNILHLADVHLGISQTPHLYEELMAVVPKTIIEREIKILIVSGDYFDKELVGSHKYYATKFFANIASICDEHGIILRMVKGTKTHDQNQLTGFFGGTNTLLPNLDFKIINTVEEEELYGLKILYIPEEEVMDQIEYYKEYQQKEYNIIAGHGTWDFVPKSNFLLGNNNTDKIASPVHLVKDWSKALKKGFCVFGHIHNHPSHDNKYYYTGSFSRWVYGQEEKKGFLVSTIDNETYEYSVDFIENELAPTYNTASFESVIGSNSLKDQSLLEVRKKLKSLVEKKSGNKVRINVTDLTPNEIVILQKAASTLDFIDLSIDSTKAKEVLLEEERENNEHDYVIHPEKYELSNEDVIIKFAKDNNNENILMSDLIDVISSKEDKDGKRA